MSRVGNNPIAIPEGVVVDIHSNQITVKGKLGELVCLNFVLPSLNNRFYQICFFIKPLNFCKFEPINKP